MGLKNVSTSLTVLLSCVFVCVRVGMHMHVHMCIRAFGAHTVRAVHLPGHACVKA